MGHYQLKESALWKYQKDKSEKRTESICKEIMTENLQSQEIWPTTYKKHKDPQTNSTQKDL